MLCELIYSNGIYENVVLILVLMEDALRGTERIRKCTPHLKS